MWTSVMLQFLSVTLMPIARTLSALIVVHVKLDLLETEKRAQVRLLIQERIKRGVREFNSKVWLWDKILHEELYSLTTVLYLYSSSRRHCWEACHFVRWDLDQWSGESGQRWILAESQGVYLSGKVLISFSGSLLFILHNHNLTPPPPWQPWFQSIFKWLDEP